MKEKIRVEGVSKIYDSRRVLKDLSLVVREGEVLALVGPSGSGKSTFLRILNRLIEPEEGEVYLEGTPIKSLDPVIVRRKVGMVFQLPALFEGTVEDNIIFGPRVNGMEGLDEISYSAIKKVGLPSSYLSRDASRLSVGEQQRVAIARALANNPQVLLMDEPTSALDPGSKEVVEDLILKLKDLGITFVVVTHSRAQAEKLGDRIVKLQGGENGH